MLSFFFLDLLLCFIHFLLIMLIRCFLSFTFSSLVAIKLVNTLGWVGWERWGFSEHSVACDLFEQCQGCRGSRWNFGTRASCTIGGGREMKISWNLWLSATVQWVDFENGNFKSKIFVLNVYLQEILNSTSLVNIPKCFNELLVNLKWQWWVRMSVRWYGTAWALPIKGINLTEGGGGIPLLMAPLIFVHFE